MTMRLLAVFVVLGALASSSSERDRSSEDYFNTASNLFRLHRHDEAVWNWRRAAATATKHDTASPS